MTVNLTKMRLEVTNARIQIARQQMALWAAGVERGLIEKTSVYVKCVKIMEGIPNRVTYIDGARSAEDSLDYVVECANEALKLD